MVSLVIQLLCMSALAEQLKHPVVPNATTFNIYYLAMAELRALTPMIIL